MEIEVIKEQLIELRTEMRYISKTLLKVEKVLENQSLLLEKQNVANKRIKDLEDNEKVLQQRIRKIEDWQIKAITIASILATVGSTLFGLIIKKFL